MTVSNTENRKTYAGNGATQTFGTSPVLFFATSDLDIYVVADDTATTLVENTDYTITAGAGDPTPLTPDYRTYGGTVDLSAGGDPYGAPAAGTTLVIVRNLPFTQASDFVNNDVNDAEVTEAALDKLTMLTQQLDERTDRSFTLADSDVSGASTELPTPVANKLLGWNSNATGLQNYGTTDGTVPVSTFMATVLDDATAAAARATMGVTNAVETLSNKSFTDFTLVASPTTGADTTKMQVTRTTTHAGGTPGVVNSALRVAHTVADGVTDFEWAVTSVMNNYASGGENVAFYGQGNKYGTGKTWAACMEAHDRTGTPNPIHALVGLEVGMYANGAASPSSRVGIDVVVGTGIAGDAPVINYGVRVGDAVDSGTWQVGYQATGTMTTAIELVHTGTKGIDLSGATLSGAAIHLKDTQWIAMDTAGTRRLYYDTGSLVYKVGSTQVFKVSDAGNINTPTVYTVLGTQVLGARVTGFTTSSGTANKNASGINADTITATDANVQALAKWVKALHDALATHGSIGA